jgi:cell division protein YceG involved in septum cleavage
VESSRISINENSNTKKRLDELFESKYKTSNGFDWRSFLFPSGVVFFRQPAFQLAFGIILIFGVSIFFVNQSPVQLAKNEVPKSEKKKTKSDSENKNLKEEQKLETSSDIESTAVFSESNFSNTGTDEITPALVSEDIFVKLEQPAEAQMEDFEGYTSGTFAADYSLAEGNKDFTAKTIQPVSSNPAVLDLLYTTY